MDPTQLVCHTYTAVGSFDLSANMVESFTMGDFAIRSFDLSRLISVLHADSPTGIDARLPTSLVIFGGQRHGSQPASRFFTRMDFSTAELSNTVFFGQTHTVDESPAPTLILHDRQEVDNEADRRRLNRLLLKAAVE
jgi:hypothetical protein